MIIDKKDKKIFEALKHHGNVCISGLTAAGKTTHSHLLAGEFGMTYVSGSQIQLNFMGVSPIQSRDFWVTEEAKKFWDADQFKKIDAELLRLECGRHGVIFDTSTMPWRHRRPALCIWLESTMESRVLKSIVSHHGRGRIAISEYNGLIAEKDDATITLYEKLYKIKIGTSLDCFDLILDISNLITEPTLTSSENSIQITHSIIRNAVGWYLTGLSHYKNLFNKCCNIHSNIVKKNNVKEAIRQRNDFRYS